MPGGFYNWRVVVTVLHVGGFWTEFRRAATTTVTPGQINYIGDLTFGFDGQTGLSSIVVTDNGAAVQQQIKNVYPKLTKAYSIKTDLTRLQVGAAVQSGRW